MSTAVLIELGDGSARSIGTEEMQQAEIALRAVENKRENWWPGRQDSNLGMLEESAVLSAQSVES